MPYLYYIIADYGDCGTSIGYSTPYLRMSKLILVRALVSRAAEYYGRAMMLGHGFVMGIARMRGRKHDQVLTRDIRH
jgi:hypothetical protein